MTSNGHRFQQSCCALALIMLLSVWPGRAQEVTARLAGTVKDPTGAVVPGAALRATSVSTGLVTRTTSSAAGDYVFLELAPGTYTLSVERTGFTTAVISGLSLNVDQKATVDVVLQVGQVTQSVQVQGEAPLVDTSSASLGAVVEQRPILDLPLNMRRTGALALIVPGTVDTSGRTIAYGTGQGGGFGDNSYSGEGGRSTSNVILIDGMVSRALNNGGFALQPVPEMVREFKIQNNTYDAAFGLASGTTMNLITESGGNSFHGSAWEYLRNRNLDARNFFATARPEYIRNQFGGALGGPIRRNKTFFFGSYEGLRQIQGKSTTSKVPTADEKAGNFSSFLTGQTANLCASSGSAAPANLNFDTGQLFDPASESLFTCPANPANPGAGTSTILVGTPIPGNVITQMDPAGQKIVALFPAPNRVGTPNYVNELPLRRPDDQFDARIDEALSDKDRLFGRYLFGNSDQLLPRSYPMFSGYQHFRGQNVVGGWTRVFSPTLINDVRIGYQVDYMGVSCQDCPRQPGLIASFGIQNLQAYRPEAEAYPRFNFKNFNTLGDGSYLPDILSDRMEKFEDTVTKVVGRHTIVAGADFNFWQTPDVEDPMQANGEARFNGQFSSLAGEIPNASKISDLADMEQGFPSEGLFTRSAFVSNLAGGGWFSLFAQDHIRVNSRLSVELGLRWEYRKLPHDVHDQLATIYPLAYNSTPGDALLLSALPDAANDALCSNSYFVNAKGQCAIMTSAMRKRLGFTGNKIREVSLGPGHGDFEPRLGVSWRPLNSNKFIVHAGAGVFNDMPITNIQGAYVNNNPVTTQTPAYSTAFGSPPPLTNRAPTTTETMFANYATNLLWQSNSQVMPSPFYHTPTVYEWSASIQSQFAQNWALEVGYVGNRGVHLDNIHVYGNQAVPGVGDLQPRRVWPDFNAILYDSYDGISSYNALQTKLTKRFSHGFQALIGYNYGSALDWNSGDSDEVSATQNDNNVRAEYGISDISIRHRLVLTPIWQLPFGKGQRFLNSGGLANALAGGWEVSGIVTFQTGFAFPVSSDQDYSNTNSSSPRPDRICNGAGPRTVAEWFNPNCFTTDALSQALANGTPRFGNSGRNILYGPGMQQWDAAFIKRNSLTEKVTLEFRAEFFNLFNHPNFTGLGSTINSDDTGQLTSAGSPRDIQFGLKLRF